MRQNVVLTRASRHFVKELGKDVPESTARRLKKVYVEKLKILTERSDENPQVTVLPKQSQGRTLLVGQQLDKSIQTFIQSLRKAGGVVNTAIVNDVHKELVFNWDQTGLQLVPTGEWTMHEAK